MARWMQKSGERQSWSIRILTFATAVLMLAACHRAYESAQPVIKIEHEITPQPSHVGPSTITLRLTDPLGKAVTGARIALEGNMSHAGMGPSIAEATEGEPGRYRALLNLSMSGDWIVLIHVTLSDGKKVEQQFEIRGVAAD